MAEFRGFPEAALDFYDDLEVDNTKSYWEAHKHVYSECVKAPMTALCDALAPEFGDAKIFRPYRDVRFAKDKTPYKTHQGAFVGVAPRPGGTSRSRRAASGSAAGSTRPRVSGWPRSATPWPTTRPARGCSGSCASSSGPASRSRGEQLKTSPRGYDADHPRIELLRRKQLFAAAALRVRAFHPRARAARARAGGLARVKPLVSWLAAATPS